MPSFPYLQEKAKGGIVLRPKVPVVLRHGENVVHINGLVDSGADVTVVPKDVAESLGIDLSGKESEISGLGKEAVKAVVDFVSMHVAGAFVPASRIFIPTDAISDTDQLILGHDPLFKEFNITFEYNAKRIVLNKIRH